MSKHCLPVLIATFRHKDVSLQTDPSTGAFFLEQLALAFMTSHEAGVDLKTPVASQQNQNAATNLVQVD
eukprot:SAG31_NODE_2483_length_5627_cov_3.161390_2_plen_69_part_00